LDKEEGGIGHAIVGFGDLRMPGFVV
jgi:hypothetical protein